MASKRNLEFEVHILPFEGGSSGDYRLEWDGWKGRMMAPIFEGASPLRLANSFARARLEEEMDARKVTVKCLIHEGRKEETPVIGDFTVKLEVEKRSQMLDTLRGLQQRLSSAYLGKLADMKAARKSPKPRKTS